MGVAIGDTSPELREGRTEAGFSGGDSAGSAPGRPGSDVHRRPFLLGLSHREVAGGNHPPATSARFGTLAVFEDGFAFPGGYGLGFSVPGDSTRTARTSRTARAGPGPDTKEGAQISHFERSHPKGSQGPRGSPTPGERQRGLL